MAGFLIAEEGPLTGLVIRFEEGEEWVLGRDPDVSTIVLEDPMVSRKHIICRLTAEGYILENLSSVNPATQNGKVIAEPILLREGDIIQIGSTFFRFSEKDPSSFKKEGEIIAPSFEEEDLSSIDFDLSSLTKWLLKVISGPNAGAEFGLLKSTIYILGKDPNLCDLVFQDLSVSRQHARISVDEEENVFIEDLGSRNGVVVNGELITDKRLLNSQDLVTLGTTSFLVIDREQVRETILSPAAILPIKPEPQPAEGPTLTPSGAAALRRNWRDLVIPKRHLAIAALFFILLFLVILALFSLFKTEPVAKHEKNENEQIQEALSRYQDIQFSFNQTNGKLFLVSHVLTNVDKQELLYTLKTLPFIQSIEDNIVIDEYVWQNMNALLATNPDWQGVSFYSPVPGRFVMRGYLQTLEQGQALVDYVNINFPYLDRLENQVVVEHNLMIEIENMLIEKGFSGVTFELSNGEVVLSGRVDAKASSLFTQTVNQLKTLKGIRMVKNYVIFTSAETSRIDLTSHYQVSGYSKKDDTSKYVVINGRILSKGDLLDGMTITAVLPNMVLLEKDGLKFKINYNLQ